MQAAVAVEFITSSARPLEYDKTYALCRCHYRYLVQLTTLPLSLPHLSACLATSQAGA